MDSPEKEPRFKHVALGIVLNQPGKVLIIQRKKKEKSGRSTLNWVFPGGKLKNNEDKYSAVKREVLEETGYQVKVKQQISQRIHPQFPVQLHYIAAQLESNTPGQFNQQEVKQVKWVKPQQLEDYFTSDFDLGVQRFLGLKGDDHEA